MWRRCRDRSAGLDGHRVVIAGGKAGQRGDIAVGAVGVFGADGEGDLLALAGEVGQEGVDECVLLQMLDPDCGPQTTQQTLGSEPTPIGTGATVVGQIRPPKENERYFALLRVEAINAQDPNLLTEAEDGESSNGPKSQFNPSS